MVDNPEDRIGTPANIVTMVRIALIPVFMVLLLVPWPLWTGDPTGASAAQPWVAATAFAVIAATDALDGYLARSRNEVTKFGKFFDPLADKILVCAGLVGLVELGLLPSWVVVVVMAREFMVSGLRMMVATQGIVIAAGWTGKWKTAVTMFAIIAFIIMDSPAIAGTSPAFHAGFQLFSWLLMTAALVLTVWSMGIYFAKAWPAMSSGADGKGN